MLWVKIRGNIYRLLFRRLGLVMRRVRAILMFLTSRCVMVGVSRLLTIMSYALGMQFGCRDVSWLMSLWYRGLDTACRNLRQCVTSGAATIVRNLRVISWDGLT